MREQIKESAGRKTRHFWTGGGSKEGKKMKEKC